MCHRFRCSAENQSLDDGSCSSFPFAGPSTVYSRDFCQILPVVPGGSRPQIVSSYLKWSPRFSLFRLLRLTEDMPLACLIAYASASPAALACPEYLLRVREGRVPSLGSPDMILLPSSATFSASLLYTCLQVFEGIRICYVDEYWLISGIFLKTNNSNLSTIIDVVDNLTLSPYKTFSSPDTVTDEVRGALRYPVKLLSTLSAGTALPNHCIKLKKSFAVTLLRSLDPASDRVNSARYVLEDTPIHLLNFRLATNAHKGDLLWLTRLLCRPGDDDSSALGFAKV